MRKSDVFVAKIVNTRLTKIFMAIFASDERLPSSATLLQAGVEILQCAVLRKTKVRNLNKPLTLTTKPLIIVQETCLQMGSL